MLVLKPMTPTVLTLIPLLVLFLVLAALAVWIAVSRGNRSATWADLAERVAKSGSETREMIADRLNRHFADSQERTDRTLAQNRKELQEGLSTAAGTLEKRFHSLENQVSQRLDAIGKSVEFKLDQNLKEGFVHFEKVQQHLQAAEQKLAALNTVGQSISDLNNLLKLPHLRGGFGEAALERLLADFLPVGSFETQYYLVPGSQEHVDAVVKLARNQLLPIDSKFPREQVLPLFETDDPGALREARETLAAVTRELARSIAKKYIHPEHGTTDMALLFLPSETLYFEVIRNGKLFEDITKLKVYPVSPNTLSMGLRSVSMAQEYYEMSRGVESTIEELSKAKRHFDHFEKRFVDIGDSLKTAQRAFDTAFTHLGNYEKSVFRLTGAPGEAAPAPTAIGTDQGTAPGTSTGKVPE